MPKQTQTSLDLFFFLFPFLSASLMGIRQCLWVARQQEFPNTPSDLFSPSVMMHTGSGKVLVELPHWSAALWNVPFSSHFPLSWLPVHHMTSLPVVISTLVFGAAALMFTPRCSCFSSRCFYLWPHSEPLVLSTEISVSVTNDILHLAPWTCFVARQCVPLSAATF